MSKCWFKFAKMANFYEIRKQRGEHWLWHGVPMKWEKVIKIHSSAANLL